MNFFYFFAYYPSIGDNLRIHHCLTVVGQCHAMCDDNTDGTKSSLADVNTIGEYRATAAKATSKTERRRSSPMTYKTQKESESPYKVVYSSVRQGLFKYDF